jgi:hypothetical protein
MNAVTILILALLLVPFTAGADVNRTVDPLPCGIYDEEARPLVEKDLDTRHADKSLSTMRLATKTGKRLSVEVRSVEIAMPGERAQVSVFLDDRPLAKTSHQDVPIYLEVHVDHVRYRIICVRVDEAVASEEPVGTEAVSSRPAGTGQVDSGPTGTEGGQNPQGSRGDFRIE